MGLGRAWRLLAGLRRREDWNLLGPLFFYDLVRTYRTGRPIFHRFLYGLFLLGVLFLLYWNLFPQSVWTRSRDIGFSLPMSQRARLAGTFFEYFICAQYALIWLITPLYTTSAIQDGKSDGTLDLLFLSELSDSQIVLGLLSSRVSTLFLLLLTGMPILALAELLGGIEPAWVLAGMVMSSACLLSVGAISTYLGIRERRLGEALTAGYLISATAAFGPGMACFMLLHYRVDPLPYAAKISIFGVYLLAQAAVLVFFCRAAVKRLHIIERDRESNVQRVLGSQQVAPSTSDTDKVEGARSKRQADRVQFLYPVGPAKRKVPSPRDRYRPPVGVHSLIWKEIYSQWNTILSAGVASAVLLVALAFLYSMSHANQHVIHGNKLLAYHACRAGACLCLAFALLTVGLVAAGKISKERQHRTLDLLLTLPFRLDSILFAKWSGSLAYAFIPLIALTVVWLLAALSGGISLVSIALVGLSFGVFSGFIASLGACISAITTSRLPARLYTLIALGLLLIGPGKPFAIASRALGVIPDSTRPNRLGLLLDIGLNPFTNLVKLTFLPDAIGPDRYTHQTPLNAVQEPYLPSPSQSEIRIAMSGVGLYAIAAAGLWMLARWRLSRQRC